MIINLQIKRISMTAEWNIYTSFTYKMAAKTSWHRYRTKLRDCLPMYMIFDTLSDKHPAIDLPQAIHCYVPGAWLTTAGRRPIACMPIATHDRVPWSMYLSVRLCVGHNGWNDREPVWGGKSPALKNHALDGVHSRTTWRIRLIHVRQQCVLVSSYFYRLL